MDDGALFLSSNLCWCVTDFAGSLFPDDWKETRVFLSTAELEREGMGFVKHGWMDLVIRVALVGTEGTNPATTSYITNLQRVRSQRRVPDLESGTLMRVKGMFVHHLHSLLYGALLE